MQRNGQENRGADDSQSNKDGFTPVMAEPQDGCVVLGKAGNTNRTYNTRYLIDHKLQHKDMARDILKETFMPCLMAERRESIGSFLWAFFSSESFLLSLHLLALALGVSKEALRIRDTDEELELIHSSVETTAACVQIIIRGASAWLEYRSISSHVMSVEQIEKSKAAKGKSLKASVIGFCVLCGLLVILSMSCMIAFKYLAHLGWTILSNNFVLVVAMVAAGIIKDRMDKVISVIREDQHKAVLYEATLLLKEAHEAFQSKAPGQYFYKVNTFVKTLKQTDLFDRPDHIRVMDKYSSDLSLFVTMDMQGM